MNKMPQTECKVNIIGAGLAGLSAALKLSEAGVPSRLISVQTSERAQSNLAEGGINACMNVMGEDDHVYEHFADTIKGGCDLADPNMAAGLCLGAPGIIKELTELGVPFQREGGKPVQRNFGGQKKKRTAYVKSSTGKMITAAVIDAVRRYECEGLVERLCHHEFRELMLTEGACIGVRVHDQYTDEDMDLPGSVLFAAGGLNGMFSGQTTGSTANTGDAAAVLFAQGVEMANPEMIQYHPTTVKIAGKRMLISEAARGEGGRLFFYDDRQQMVRFMEDKYGERGNLMPRDVVSREMASCGRQVYLDLTGLSEKAWEKKLSDLRSEIIHYTAFDPKYDPIPVAPGIHFFMGGILINEAHETNIRNLSAAGECACGYHGANRLGGNSLLGAIYGGKKAADAAAKGLLRIKSERGRKYVEKSCSISHERSHRDTQISGILIRSLPVLRSEEEIARGVSEIRKLRQEENSSDSLTYCRLLLAEAILCCALERKESRGAHYVKEYPERRGEFRKTSTAVFAEGKIQTGFREIPELRESMRKKIGLEK